MRQKQKLKLCFSYLGFFQLIHLLLLIPPVNGISQSSAVVEWDYDTPSSKPGFELDDNWIFTTIQASDGSIIGVGFSDKYDAVNGLTTGYRHPAVVKFSPGPARAIQWERIPTFDDASVPYVVDNSQAGGFNDVFEYEEDDGSYIYACGIIRITGPNTERIPIIAKFRLSDGGLVYYKTIENFTHARFTRMFGIKSSNGLEIYIAGESSYNGSMIKATIFKLKADGTLDSGFNGNGWRTYPPNFSVPSYFKDLTYAPAVVDVEHPENNRSEGLVAVGSIRTDNPPVNQPSRDVLATRIRLSDGGAEWTNTFTEASLGTMYTDLNSSAENPFCTGTDETGIVAPTTTETGNEEGFAIRSMSDGNFAVVARFDFIELSGSVLPGNTSGASCRPFNTEQYYDNDVAVVKLDKSSGQPLYAIDAGRSVAIDGWNTMVKDCNEIYICANTFDPGTEEVHGSILCVTDNYGSFTNRWRKDTRGKGWAFCAFGITKLEDGGLLLCGNNWKNGDDYELIKFSNPAYANITYTEGPTIINSSVNWNTAKKVNGTISVLSGGILTIENTTIEFANTYLTNDWNLLAQGLGNPTKIVVHPNGKLILKNCVLKGATTTSCASTSRDWMWEGITLLGNQNAASTPANQGFLSMSLDAQIQDAYVGIHAGSTYYNSDGRSTSTGAHGGGIIHSNQPSNSIIPNFLNCRRSVWLAPSKNVSTTSALFVNTRFLCNQAMKDAGFTDPNGSGEGMGPAFMVGSWDRDKMTFYNCTFRSTGPYAYNLRGTAIETFDAAFSVTNSIFYQLSRGIYARYGLGVTDAVQVHNSDFFEVRKGSHIIGGSLHRFTASDFDDIPESLLDDDNYGIRFEGAGNLTVSNNNTFSSDFANTYGIIVKDSYSKGSDFFDNDFTNLGYGVQTEKNNLGLQIRCNDYTNNEIAWSINPESIVGATGLFENQGICGQFARQAGNLFNDPDCPGGTPESHIRSKVNFSYRARSGGSFSSNEIPTCVSSGGSAGTVTVELCGSLESNSNTCASLCQSCPPTPDPWKDQVLGNKIIAELLDSSEVEDALAMIALLYPDDPGYYIGALINAGLYEDAEEKLEEWSEKAGKPDPMYDILAYIVDLYGKGGSFMDLDKGDLETLEGMAMTAENSFAQYYIQNILAFVRGVEYENPIEKWDEEQNLLKGSSKDVSQSNVSSVLKEEMTVQPNPASDVVTIRWSTPQPISSGSLELRDVRGRLLQSIPVNMSDNVRQVNVGDLPAGVYIFRLQGASSPLAQKIVIE